MNCITLEGGPSKCIRTPDGVLCLRREMKSFRNLFVRQNMMIAVHVVVEGLTVGQ